MTPLEGIIEAEGLAAPDELPRHLLGELHTEGFERTVEWWSPGDATVWADAAPNWCGRSHSVRGS
jgi:hypothetical protein